VAEINDVVRFLAPERIIQLELIHYETHAYTDMGGPQQVIYRLIPVDYDIHLAGHYVETLRDTDCQYGSGRSMNSIVRWSIRRKPEN
jgi:hypothetical protein